MKRMINISNYEGDLGRFDGEADLRDFLKKYDCDGYELLTVAGAPDCAIPHDLVPGVHLTGLNSWMDLWLGNEDRLLKEYDNWETVEQTFGGRDKEALIRLIRKDLDLAKKVQAEYVVFHVCEVKLGESITYDFDYTDEEVIDAVCDWVNELLDGQDYDFYFLLENLWWPGLTLTRPEITERLMNGIHYNKKGIMLDTGHLLHTNLDIATQEEGVEYILKHLKAHGELVKYIKGIHLNQSLTGDVVKKMLADPIHLADSYYDRWCQLFSYIFQIDTHQPFTAAGVKDIIQYVNPEFLTMELISDSREEHEKMLQAQVRAL